MLDQLKRDKEEKFGKGAGGSATTSTTGISAQAKVVAPFDIVKTSVKMVKTVYTEDRNPGVAKTCLKTCTVYISNVLKDVKEEKYRRINSENEAFKKRVGRIGGGLAILKAVGFHDQDDGTLFMDKVDEELLRETLALLESEL